MSSLTAELPLIPIPDSSTRAHSEPPPSQEFPRAVNWSNPRVAAILDAAAECFSTRGFTATTLADIGKELGLRKSIVHYYFKSKGTLVEEVQSYTYSRYVEVMRRALGHDGCAQGEVGKGEMTYAASPDGPVSEPPASAARRVGPREVLSSGLKRLWQELKQQNSIRGLNLELWSEGRRNEELALRAQSLEAEVHRLMKSYFLASKSAVVTSDAEADDLTTLSLAVLDGLNVRDERDGPNERTARAFEFFLKMLDR